MRYRFRFLDLFRFKKCKMCGKYYWIFNHSPALHNYCSFGCLVLTGMDKGNLRYYSESLNDLVNRISYTANVLSEHLDRLSSIGGECHSRKRHRTVDRDSCED